METGLNQHYQRHRSNFLLFHSSYAAFPLEHSFPGRLSDDLNCNPLSTKARMNPWREKSRQHGPNQTVFLYGADFSKENNICNLSLSFKQLSISSFHITFL